MKRASPRAVPNGFEMFFPRVLLGFREEPKKLSLLATGALARVPEQRYISALSQRSPLQRGTLSEKKTF